MELSVYSVDTTRALEIVIYETTMPTEMEEGLIKVYEARIHLRNTNIIINVKVRLIVQNSLRLMVQTYYKYERDLCDSINNK